MTPLREQDISIEVFGNKIHGSLSTNSISNKPKPLIVLNSGYGPSGSNSSTWKRFLASLNQIPNDTIVLKWDYVGQGLSDGSMKDLTPFRALAEMHLMLEKAKTIEDVDESQISIYGSSFGGYIALLYAAIYGGVKQIFLKSPASDYAEIRRITLGDSLINKWREIGLVEVEEGVYSPYEFFAQSLSIDIYSKIAPNVNCNVKIVHGDADTNVPISQSYKLVDALPNAQLKIFEGVNHGYKENDGANRITDLAVEFFRC